MAGFYIRTLEHREKMRSIKNGTKNTWTKKGRKVTWGHKISEGKKGKMTGKDNPFYGKKHKYSQVGAKNPNWKGGKTPEGIIRTSTPEWDKIRKKVYERDNWTCQVCNKHCRNSDIQCHHIIPYRITKDNLPGNLITLCRSCHSREENRYYHSLGKMYYFKKINK